MHFDATSLLVEVSADAPMHVLCAFVAEHAAYLTRSTLSEETLQSSVGDWLANGAQGAHDPWADPADHLVAGLSAVLPNGAALELRPCPRRAAGPDLVALFAGQRRRMGTLTRVWLRVHTEDSEVRGLVFERERNPAVTTEEAHWIAALSAALANVALVDPGPSQD
jgi:alkyldihydroxyacetonephosphate synthase